MCDLCASGLELQEWLGFILVNWNHYALCELDLYAGMIIFDGNFGKFWAIQIAFKI
ncbi:MAG: hypothetical protein IPP06_17610 [Saprospiraceae bacterium]|nr:hypothetical protein [Candidatus Vicinibacter affinis]